MKKLKKAIALFLVIALTAGIAIAGTLAYLTDTDSAVNTMTVGNVDIIQHEQQRAYENGAYTGLTDFMDGPLHPITQDTQAGYSNYYDVQWNETTQESVEYGMFSNANNAVDKIVTVENTGISSAYVRTIFAFEMKMVDGAALDPLGTDVMYVVNDFDINWIKDNEVSDQVDANNEFITIKLRNGTWYIVGVYYYDVNGDGTQESLLNPGQTTEASLLQLYLKGTAGNQWYEQVGGKYEVLVLSQAIQSAGFAGAESALNQGFGVVNETNALTWFDGLVDEAADTWDGTADTSWYNENDTEFMIMTAEQLAGFAELVDGGYTFAGKTVKLGRNIDLYYLPEGATEPQSFDPIGDDSPFSGTFDGQGYTISNLYQSGWAFGYEWGKYGSIGLFGELKSATVKNLTISGAESYVEGGDVGGITGSASGTCVFENITIEDSIFATYNNGNGGIIGWSGAGEYTFKNIAIAEDTVLAGLWGSFDSSIGGVVGQGEPGATYNFENVDIACRLDVYNDCTASYDYYNYRMCGMIIGRLEETTTIDGVNYPDMSKYNITCKDVTVTYGEWANYHYCEPTPGHNNGRGMRVEPGYSYGGLPADYDHSQCVDNHMNLIPFDQIFGGDQLGVKGLKAYDGVTVNYNNR